MSRCNYSEDLEQWELIRWRGAVMSAIRGKRGQLFLREMLAALEALPEKRLIAHDLKNSEGVCAIGSVGLARGIDMEKLDPEEPSQLVRAFGISDALVREIEYVNDESPWPDGTPEKRFQVVRDWIISNLKEPC